MKISKLNFLFGAVMYFVANGALLRPVSAGVSKQEESEDIITIETAKKEIGLTRKLLRSERRSQTALDSESRRRKRSAQEAEFLAFRQFVHSLRRRSGGLEIDGEEIVRRNTGVTVMERGSVGRTIASKVTCGECKLTKQWIPVNKKGCRTNYVLAPTCMGMCETWEVRKVSFNTFVSLHKQYQIYK